MFKLVILAPRHSSGLLYVPSKVIGAYCTTTDADAESNLNVLIQSPPNHSINSCVCRGSGGNPHYLPELARIKCYLQSTSTEKYRETHNKKLRPETSRQRYLSEELEKIQRRALRIIFPDLGYQEALKECNISTLHQRRQWLTERLFNEIKDNSLHKLHGLLPPRNLSTVALRRKRAFNVPLCRTNRLMNSFIMHNAAIF